MIKNHYYKNFWDKSAYLFVSVAEGHFFSNGNKRLALSLLAKFYEINFIVKENFHTKNLAKSWEIYSQNII